MCFVKSGAILLKNYMTFDEALTEALIERERLIWENSKHEYSKPPLSFDEFMKKYEFKIKNDGDDPNDLSMS